MKTIKSQAGHAALLFALFIPVLFGIFALATDGARAIQDKARLEEATEVAALAVAGQNSDVEATQKATAKKYIEYYFPNAEVSGDDIEVVKLSCEDNPECDNSGDSQRFFQYSVNASIVETSWFPGNKAIVGIGETYDVAGYSVARKYQSKTVDVIFIADFSGSMRSSWSYTDSYTNKTVSVVKYKELLDIISEVMDELQDYNDNITDSTLLNRAGFTAFDYRIFNRLSSEVCYGNGRHKNCYNYESVDLDPDSRASYTVKNIFNSSAHNTSFVSSTPQYYSIAATSDFESLDDTISGFSPYNGTTASFLGLMEGANIAYDITSPNPRQLLIILSDGADYPESNMSRMKSLVSAGMCSTILSTLQARTSTSSEGITESVKARIAMIGFGYDTDDNEGLTDCVGEDNVFEADNRDAIKNKILELITEEIGHLAPEKE